MRGLYFEEMEIGRTIDHAYRRTVTETDNVLFTSLTMNPAPLHLDAEYAKTLPYGRPLMNSLFIVGLIGGITVPELVFKTSLGNLGYSLIEFPAPVFAGDTIRAETTILDKRLSKSDPSRGVVWFEHRGYNQDHLLICLLKRTGMAMTRPSDAEYR